MATCLHAELPSQSCLAQAADMHIVAQDTAYELYCSTQVGLTRLAIWVIPSWVIPA